MLRILAACKVPAGKAGGTPPVVFSSITFLFYFLPLFLAAYYLLPARNAVFLVFSLAFYTLGEGPTFCCCLPRSASTTALP